MLLRHFARPLMFVCFTLFAFSGRAQITNVTNSTSTPTAGSGHDYIHMVNETVNPANGSVSIRVSAPVPQGRELTLPFNFAYDSNGALILYPTRLGEAGFGSNTTFLSQGGWSYGVPLLSANYILKTEHTPNGQPITCEIDKDFVFQGPSGDRHPLGLASTEPHATTDCSDAPWPSGGDDFVLASQPNCYGYNCPVKVVENDGTVFNFPGSYVYFAGRTQSFESLPGSVEDRNGNKITVTSSSGGVFAFTDTAGRTAISSSGFGASGNTVTISGLSGSYTVYWGTATTNFSVNPQQVISNSNCFGLGAAGGSLPVITAIVLPNGQEYQFSYDQTYGLLNQITYPSGAWIKYSWALNPQSEFGAFPDTNGSPSGCAYHYDWPVINHRYVSFDGTNIALQQDFSYSLTWNPNDPTSWLTKQTIVTTHDLIRGGSFQTTYSYIPVTIKNQPYDFGVFAAQIPVESTVVYGDWNGATLKTVTKTWQDAYQMVCESTTLPTGQISRSEYAYGRGLILADKKEWDWGQAPVCGNATTGSPARETAITFQTFANTPIYPNAASIADEPSSVIIYGNGTRVTETDYAYDQPSVTTVNNLPTGTHDETNYSPSSTAARGNATTITKQCFQGSSNCTNSVMTQTFDETGQVLSKTDPCGNTACSDMTGSNHTTSYSYSDNFDSPPTGNTNAYLTQVTDALGHTTKYKYAYGDGQLIQSQDQNDINASRPGTTYMYADALRRLTETDYQDGGKTTITYNDTAPSPTVTTSKLITTTLPLTTVAVMDGIGHVVQTQITSDPDGTDFTDTTYDGSGLVWKQSNPHRSSSLSSDGMTTNYFDALGRPCLVVPPDGTLPTGTPCASQPANTVFTSYSGNAVTVTDQAGNTRRGISDGLGRLIEVDEPGASSPATPSTGSGTVTGSEQSIGGTPATSGTGSVTFSGTLQSKVTQAATPGSGSVTFNGSLQSKQVLTQAATAGSGTVTIKSWTPSGNDQQRTICNKYCQTVYDYGYVSITVNGVTISYSYGQGDTPARVATALANGINGNTSINSLVLGSASNQSTTQSTVTINARGVGSQTNYSLSASSATQNRTYFSVSSFPASASGATLTGGQDAVYTTIYDSGSCTITVNSQGDSTSWSGSGTTKSSIASALASAISGDGSASVNASASGGTVSLIARATGAATNYGLSSSCSYDSSNFGGPSFSTSNSGSTLTGGANAVTTYDSGTSTITVNGHADSFNWSGSGTTTSSIASVLASSINADSTAPVSASASGATVSFTAKTTGASTNYSLSSSSTYNSTVFSSPSFSSSNSGSTLTGGSNGTATVYDTGSVWIKVAGFQASVNYGQTDTSSSVASGLAAALNGAGSPVTASASSGNISLTAKATGANTNYTLSGGSSTSQPSSFSQPSFTISVSGSTLTGGSSPTLSLSTPAITTYNYDQLDNLIGVIQSGSRQRTFAYDSLSRLISAANPESGTTNYSYDADGNVSTKTAPAANQPGATTVTTTFSYDVLNRLTQKSYSDGTATITYGYDALAPAGCTPPSLTINNAVGRRTGMCDAAGAEAWSYDIVSGTGWKTTDVRSTSGVTQATVAQDNLDGSVSSITYPSGHVISYGPGGAGRPLSATDTSANISYATNAHYWPSGALGNSSNGSSISFTAIFNSRSQPCWMYATTGSALPWNSTACSATAATGNILDLKYNLNLGSADNGNVASITNNRDTTRSQTFAYDLLNRLVTAQTSSTYSTSPSNCFGESFGYDAWGNLLFVSESSSSYDGCTSEPPQGWTMTANNQIQSSLACFDGSGNLLTVATYCYDAAGNLLTNTALSFAYDAENHLKSIPMLGISYLYDGEGRRVAKANSSGQATKLYWYGMDSDPLDETDGTGATNNSNFFEYAFLNGQRIARRDSSNNVNYYFADHLGTARIVANSSGIVVDDSDFYPFGGERIVTSSSGNSYKFTGKERDSESGLDYFGARYNSSSMGRFMSPDWSTGSVPVPYADLSDPQSLNLYSYVENNPLGRADLDGHCWVKVFGQRLCNWVDWGHFVDNAHLDAALQQDADKARANIANTQNMTFNGQNPGDFAASLNNKQAILAQRALTEYLASLAMLNLQKIVSPCAGTDMRCGIMFPVDFATSGTVDWSATVGSEGEARAFARTKLGSDAVEVEPGKWRSRNGKWQYRAKPGDVSDNHVHLEQLNPQTGEVIQNLHLRWPEGTGRP